MKNRLLGIACIAALSGILMAGLWPFHAPRDEVTWLPDRNGLRFGEHGTIMSNGAFNQTGSRDPQPCSLELWLQPANDNGGALLSSYTPDNPLQLSLYQSHTDLVLQSVSPVSPGRARLQRISVNDVFRQRRPLFVSVTSGAQGTALYARRLKCRILST